MNLDILRSARSYKRGQHPDRLHIGMTDRCPRCRSALTLVVPAHGGISTHTCQDRRCTYTLACPGHQTNCILGKIVRHEKLPKCARGHSGTWVCLAGQKGRIYNLACFSPSTASGFGYCGASYKHWIGAIPSLPKEVGVDRAADDATKFGVLLAYSKYEVLTPVQCAGVAGLELRPVRACIRRLLTKRLPHLEYSGDIYDGGSDKRVQTYKINSTGMAWLRFQQSLGRFTDGKTAGVDDVHR